MKHSVLVVLATCVLAATASSQDLYDMDTVRAYHLTFKQSDWWNQLVRNKSSRTDIRADLKVDGKTYKDVGVRIRGNTSYSWNRGTQKVPFNIRTDAFVANQDLLGYTNLNLLNGYKDATFLREPIAYMLMRRHLPALKSCWITLWINGTFWGVYVHNQQYNKTYLREWFEEEDGNMYRGDAPRRNSRPTLTYLGNNPSSYARVYDHKTTSHPSPWVDLINMTRVLDTDPISQLPQSLPKVLNVDGAMWYIALQNILSNTDSYIGTGNDYLAFNDEEHGRFQIMPWDLNTTFGGYDWPGKRLGASGLKRMDPFYDGGTLLRRPLETRIWAVAKWRERYLAHFRTMLDDWFDWKVVEPTFRKYHKLLEPHVKADTKKLYTTQQFYDNLTKDVRVRDCCGTYTIPGLKDFFETKRAFLLQHSQVNRAAPKLSDLAQAPARPTTKDRVFVTARVGAPAGKVTLFWRVKGEFLEAPMFDDGQHGDGKRGDGVYGGIVPPQNPGKVVEYYVGAAASTQPNAAVTFLPRRTTHALASYRIQYPIGTSPIRLNEILARNTKGARDEKGELEDWLELVNTSANAVDVGGMYLTDKLGNPKKWQLPVGTRIPAGGALLVWADEDGTQGPLHANFKLASDGEDVALFDRDGKTQLDVFSYGKQQADVSTGRLFDGRLKALWVTFADPTPAKPNAAGTCGTRRYSALDSLAHVIGLDLDATPRIASVPRLQLTKGPANSAFIAVLSAGAGYVEVSGRFSYLLGLPLTLAVIPSNGQGAASVPFAIPDEKGLIGKQLYVQGLAIDAQGLFASNALEITFCPK